MYRHCSCFGNKYYRPQREFHETEISDGYCSITDFWIFALRVNLELFVHYTHLLLLKHYGYDFNIPSHVCLYIHTCFCIFRVPEKKRKGLSKRLTVSARASLLVNSPRLVFHCALTVRKKSTSLKTTYGSRTEIFQFERFGAHPSWGSLSLIVIIRLQSCHRG